MKKFNLKELLANNVVTILFLVICIVSIPISGYSPGYLISEVITRISRNSFLVLSLLIPVLAGMGMNFGMTLGAMAGQIGLIYVCDWNIVGIPGLVLAAIISTPISIILGYVCGQILNRARGREMVTSYIIGFFMNGVYQFFVLYLMGSLIPIRSSSLILPRINMRKSLDNLLDLRIGGVQIPIATFIVIAIFCVFFLWFKRTKLGQDMKAVGQDNEIAREAGIKVEKTRILSIVLSTVFAGYGMIIYLQNIGTLNTYNSHSQIGTFSIAALLVGGASVDKANIRNVFLGIILFHLMFVIAPMVGRNLIGQAQLGEYFRVFVSYAVITLALVLYEMRKRRAAKQALEAEV